MPISASIPIGIVIQWCTTDVLIHKRHPFIFLSFILTMMANHHLSSFIAAVHSLERLCLLYNDESLSRATVSVVQ